MRTLTKTMVRLAATTVATGAILGAFAPDALAEGSFSSSVKQVQPQFDSRTWKDRNQDTARTKITLSNCKVNAGGKLLEARPCRVWRSHSQRARLSSRSSRRPAEPTTSDLKRRAITSSASCRSTGRGPRADNHSSTRRSPSATSHSFNGRLPPLTTSATARDLRVSGQMIIRLNAHTTGSHSLRRMGAGRNAPSPRPRTFICTVFSSGTR